MTTEMRSVGFCRTMILFRDQNVLFDGTAAQIGNKERQRKLATLCKPMLRANLLVGRI